MRKVPKSYTKDDILRAEERGRRIGMIQGVEEFERRLLIDFEDDRIIDTIKAAALKYKRSVERHSLLK